MRTEFPDDWLDAEESIHFLRLLRPEGPWLLAALYLPNSPRVAGDDGRTVRTLVAYTASKAKAFIDGRAGHANLHFIPNHLQWGAVREKPSAALLTAFSHAHVDLDCDKEISPDEPALEVIERRKAETLQRLRAFDRPGPPSLVVDSGGGLQALWELDQPMPITGTEDLETAKAVNRGLVRALDGDPACINPCHMLRLPGAPNLPNELKIKRGRVPAPARLVR